jgi:adenylate kinase family enzyme
MHRFVVIGNSGSGKSTLAQRLAAAHRLAHLDLDIVAWVPEARPPQRRAVAESAVEIGAFLAQGEAWIVEGCYADLVALVVPQCTQLLFLDPGADACVANACARPWEPHKYATKEEQDAGLDFLVGWIRDYDTRTDVFSRAAHRALFDGFAGRKTRLATREEIAGYAAAP